MTLEMWITLGVLVAAIVLFITEWLRVDVVALGVVITLMVTNVIGVSEALSGFSNTAVLTIAALFVVGGGVLQTGLADAIGRRILRVAGTEEIRLIVVIMLAVALMSAFMSDTGTVAVLLPAIVSLAGAARLSPAKLLIPLAYGSLLGGAMSLIGTPPNIIVTDLLRSSGYEPFHFFSFTPIGITLLIAGLIFMLVIGRRLLPAHSASQDVQRIATPQELIDLYQLPDNLFRLRVRRISSIRDQTIAETHLGEEHGITIIKILRTPPPRSVARIAGQELVLQAVGELTIQPDADTIFESDDLLIVQGTADDVRHAAANLNLSILPHTSDQHDEELLIDEEVGIAELVLPPRSQLVGNTLVDIRFGTRYKLSVLSINRPSTEDRQDLKTTELQFGDILLVQGRWRDILDLRNHRRDFVVTGQPERMIGAPNRTRAPIAMLILLVMLTLMVSGVLPTVTASMLAGLLMILTGCLSMDDAYAAIDWKSIVLVAGMIPMSIALQNVGLVDLVADGLTTSLGNYGPLVVMGGLFMLTSIFTQVLSNTATTVLVAPIALATALQLGVAPYAFLMAVAIAASMAFATPVASPVNTLVMGAGSYRFSDYIKIGVPMIILTMVVALLVLPLLFPF